MNIPEQQEQSAEERIGSMIGKIMVLEPQLCSQRRSIAPNKKRDQGTALSLQQFWRI
jgi:hypothetical protein